MGPQDLRKIRVIADRARMAERALQEAGYLTGEEGERTPEFFRTIAMHFLADLLHLADQEGAQLSRQDGERILANALLCFMYDGGRLADS